MEANPRSFEPVKIGMVNVEPAYERFHKVEGRLAPAISFWRVNLTALSQRHNLYFLAVRDKIQVYRPEFPYQTLGPSPSLIISPQLAAPTAQGYIDPREPHNINHLVVGNLGNQEILLLSTDSGNVAAYYTSSIYAGVKKDPYQFSTDGSAEVVGVRPFFAQWVHESAWGLAIHSQGRMIAVSANTPYHIDDSDPSSKITVFAFALTPSEGMIEASDGDCKHDLDSTGCRCEWKLWRTPREDVTVDGPRRDRNYKIILGGYSTGHQQNVPCVTFINGSQDPKGAFLLSTDIRGQMKMWQVWTGSCVKTWSSGGRGDETTHWANRREGGWIVAALDIDAFRPADTSPKFIGNHTAPQHYGYLERGDSYDLTSIVRRNTPQNRIRHPLYPPSESDSSESELEKNNDELDQNAIDSDDEVRYEPILRRLAAEREAAPSPVDRDVELYMTRSQLNQLEADCDVLACMSGDDSDLEDPSNEALLEVEIVGDLSDEEDEEGSGDTNEVDDSSGSLDTATSASSFDTKTETEGETLRSANASRVGSSMNLLPSLLRSIEQKSQATSSTKRPRSSEWPRLPIVPIIQCSTSHVRLFRGPTADSPHIFCARMLRQTLPRTLEETGLASLDRLSLFQQIPELGVVIIGSQIGRCAICSLTKRTEDGLPGFRVDWILPTRRQEREGVRPVYHALIGIAVGPIQGRATPDRITSSRHDLDQSWANDRTIHGTPTTFDPEVVVLSETAEEADMDLVNSSDYLASTLARTEKRRWAKPMPEERWRSFESSRRYRLMMTYSDMTVLTYELSRGIEKDDIITDNLNPPQATTSEDSAESSTVS